MLSTNLYIDSRGGHNRATVNQEFFKKWNSSMSYILGLIFADGSIQDSRQSSRTCYLSITSNDLHILEDIREAMQSTHTITHRADRTVVIFGKEYLAKTSYRLRIGSKEIYSSLIKHGLTPRKSLNMEFPHIPKKYFFDFIRGYFDGDGCLYLKNRKYPVVIFSSGSKSFLESLNNKLGLSLPNFKAYLVSSSRLKSLYYQLILSSDSSLDLLKVMYENLNQKLYLNRKYTKYLSILL